MRTLERLLGMLRETRAELAANRRLALLLSLVPVILVAWLALLARDAATAAGEERKPLERRAARLDALSRSGDWERRISEERQALGRLSAQLWRADSAQLAAADLQTVLQRSAGEHLAWSRLKLLPPEDLPEIAGWRVRAELNGKLKDVDALALLQQLSLYSPRIMIEQLNLSLQRGRTITLKLSIVVAPEETES